MLAADLPTRTHLATVAGFNAIITDRENLNF
jgi:hypothetical protein